MTKIFYQKIFTWQLTTGGDEKQETWNRCIVATKIEIKKYVRNQNNYRIFNN